MTVIFFFNDTATTEIYTLSLHDALPISTVAGSVASGSSAPVPDRNSSFAFPSITATSEKMSFAHPLLCLWLFLMNVLSATAAPDWRGGMDAGRKARSLMLGARVVRLPRG